MCETRFSGESNIQWYLYTVIISFVLFERVFDGCCLFLLLLLQLQDLFLFCYKNSRQLCEKSHGDSRTCFTSCWFSGITWLVDGLHGSWSVLNTMKYQKKWQFITLLGNTFQNEKKNKKNKAFRYSKTKKISKG